MTALGNTWTEIARGSWSSGATLTYIIEAKLDSQSTSENKSYISTRARTVMTGNYIRSYNVHMSCTGCTSYDVDYYSFTTKTVLTGSTTVAHKSDGTGSLSMSGSCTGNLGMNITPKGSIDLPKINRYSAITSFNNFNIEDGFSFGYTDYLANKTLTLTCEMGSTSILTKTYKSSIGAHTETITFTDAQLETIYNNIGSSEKSTKFKLTLATSDISPTSTSEATGTLKKAANSPSITSWDIEETNSRMIQCGVVNSEIVRYLSSKKITATASALNGATVSSIKVKNGSSGTDSNMSVSGGVYSKTLSNLTANTFILTVTDSRGFTGTTTITGTLRNYTRPSVTNIEFDRTSTITSTGFVRPTGSYWSGTAGDTTNSVTWTYRISSTSDEQAATYTSSTWHGEAQLASGTLLRENAYECVVTVTDAFGQSASGSASIGPAKLSVWIGKETMRAEGFVGAHYIGVFPVGAIYLSTTDTNPGTYFGGTWVQIAQGRTIIGVGSLQENTVSTWGDVTVGGFNPAVNERGGTYTHRHFMNGQDADGPRAAVGAVDNDVNTIGYTISSPSAWGPGSTKMYALQATMLNKNVDHTFNHYTPVFGYARGSTVVEPYLAVYIWQRTA